MNFIKKFNYSQHYYFYFTLGSYFHNLGISKRNIEDYVHNSKDLKDIKGIGPGTYSPIPFLQETAKQNAKSPPFNTQDSKWSPEKYAIKNNIPGPGAYNISHGMNTGKVITLNMDKSKKFYYSQRLFLFLKKMLIFLKI